MATGDLRASLQDSLTKIEIAVAVTALSTASAWVATGRVRSLAIRHAILDVPNQRSSHTAPVPRGGGVAITLVSLGGLLCLAVGRELDLRIFAALAVGGLAVAGVGYADDLRPQSARVRILVHIGAAMIYLISIAAFLQSRAMPLSAFAIWIGGASLAFVLVSAVNLFNFMDGIDGIAGAEAVFVAGSGAWLNWHVTGNFGITLAMLSLSGATLGFLAWNTPPARIFMGDVGSGFLGFMLAAMGIVASFTAAIPMLVWPILGGVFIADTSVTLLRRLIRGDRWLEAHRMHAYQHAAVRWQGHHFVTMVVVLINVCWLLPWALYVLAEPGRAALALAVSLLPLIALAIVAGAGKP
jgi:Fuc2NAc and GlcNAc transferase